MTTAAQWNLRVRLGTHGAGCDEWCAAGLILGLVVLAVAAAAALVPHRGGSGR